MYRPLLFLAFFLLPLGAAQAQWEMAGPTYSNPAVAAQNSRYVFVGTDKAGGVYRSPDGGQTWERAGSTIPWDQQVLAVDASEALVAAVVRTSGSKSDFYRSTDDGATWTQRANFLPGKSGVEALYVMGADTVVAAVNVSSTYELHVSTDGGTTWTARPSWDRQVYGQVPVQVGRNLVTYRYEAAAGNATTFGLYVSSDLGATWTFRPFATRTGNSFPPWGLVVDGSRIYFRDADRYVNGGGSEPILRWTDDLGVTYGEQVFFSNGPINQFGVKGSTMVVKSFVIGHTTGNSTTIVNDHTFGTSHDGGATWQQADPDSTMLRALESMSSGVATSSFGLIATKTGFIYGFRASSGIANGVYFSPDGITWRPTAGVGVGRVLGSTTPFGEALLAFEGSGASGTGGGFFRSGDGGATWRYLAATFFNDRGEQTTCASTLAPGLVADLDSVAVAICGDKVMHSRDGVSFHEVADAPSDRLKMLVADGSRLYSVMWTSSIANGTGGTSGRLYQSHDAGRTWTQIHVVAGILSRPDASGDRLIYADNGDVNTSTDGGQTWSTFAHTTGFWRTTQVGAATTPTAFFVSAASTSWLYPDVFLRSTDDGQTWQSLKDLGVNDAPMFLHAEDDLLVAAFHDSVAVSQDDGTTWTSLKDGWPVGVNTRGQMAFVFHDSLFIQLDNNGVWSAPLSAFGIVTAVEAAAPAARRSLAAYPNPVRSDARLHFTLDRSQRVQLIAYDLLGREVARLTDRVEAAGTHDVRWEMGGLAAGVYVLRLTTDDGRSETQTVVKL